MATIFDSHFTGNNISPASLKPTQREVEAIGQALKSPDFRAILCDYVQEVSDPKNREQYIKEMTQLEAARGNHVTFLVPQPGYVIKTRVLSTATPDNEDVNEQVGKIFVNVSSDDHIEDAHPVLEQRDGHGRIPWAVPYSTSKPRRDVDKAGQQCVVYDVIFHPNVIKKTQTDYQFRQMVNATALDGLEQAHGLKLDRKRLRFPKLKFKGSTHVSVIRRPLTDKEELRSKDEEPSLVSSVTSDLEHSEIEDCDEFKEPQYVIKYRFEQRDLPAMKNLETDPCRPTSMVVEIALPELSSAKGIDLDVLEHLLTLESKEPVAYKLVLKLPYPVHEDQGSAKFDKSLHSLLVTLPVKPKDPVSRLVSIDSGIGLEFDEECDKSKETDSTKSVNKDEVILDDVERSLPAHNLHIYEDLMVVTITVPNVVADSLKKMLLDDNRGYQLTFHTLGQGFVPLYYGFCLSFDSEGFFSLGDLDCEVWDNNMILQLSLPTACQSYRVGCHRDELGQPVPMPRLAEAVKEKCILLGKKNGSIVKNGGDDLDSDDSDELAKERHSSGESHDSAVSLSVPTSPTKVESPSKRFLVIPSDFCKPMSDCNLRGILKRPRCFSESNAEFLRMMSSPAESSSSTIVEEDEEHEDKKAEKKSVRFNEVVQRQIYRSNSSILGQKHKNQKKAEQKRRKAARRASEGDMPSNGMGDFGKSPDSSENDHTNDSGLASSMDESHENKEKEADDLQTPMIEKTSKKGKRSKVVSRFIEESNSDLIFNLDF